MHRVLVKATKIPTTCNSAVRLKAFETARRCAQRDLQVTKCTFAAALVNKQQAFDKKQHKAPQATEITRKHPPPNQHESKRARPTCTTKMMLQTALNDRQTQSKRRLLRNSSTIHRSTQQTALRQFAANLFKQFEVPTELTAGFLPSNVTSDHFANVVVNRVNNNTAFIQSLCLPKR